jgi:hypothetical protein
MTMSLLNMPMGSERSFYHLRALDSALIQLCQVKLYSPQGQAGSLEAPNLAKSSWTDSFLAG